MTGSGLKAPPLKEPDQTEGWWSPGWGHSLRCLGRKSREEGGPLRGAGGGLSGRCGPCPPAPSWSNSGGWRAVQPDDISAVWLYPEKTGTGVASNGRKSIPSPAHGGHPQLVLQAKHGGRRACAWTALTAGHRRGRQARTQLPLLIYTESQQRKQERNAQPAAPMRPARASSTSRAPHLGLCRDHLK